MTQTYVLCQKYVEGENEKLGAIKIFIQDVYVMKLGLKSI